MSRQPVNQRRNSRRRIYSQNFLKDPQVAAAMVRISAVSRRDLVVEIGPGTGIVTAILARKAGYIRSYEIDLHYAQLLDQRFRHNARVECIAKDFLDTSPPDREFVVVANIPYAHTSKIVGWCLSAPYLSRATLMTQWEYALKRTGGYDRWTKLTIESWPLFDWQLCGRVSKAKFHPSPRVDSGILQLQRRTTPLLPPRAINEYRHFVALGFSGVGGNLHSSLCRQFGYRELANAFERAKLDRHCLVGSVPPTAWITLFRTLWHL